MAETASTVVAPPVRCAFVGLGAMGKGMATNLARYVSSVGQTLHVYNRDHAKAQQFASESRTQGYIVTAQTSLAEVASSCNVIFTMLSHDAAVKDVMGQLCGAMAPTGDQAQGQGSDQAPGPDSAPGLRPRPAPRILVDCSTVSPETTREVGAAAEAAGALYVACPVLGRPDAAAAAKLLLFCSGPGAAKERIMPYLSCMGRKVLDLGDQPPRASIMKLLANFHLVSLIELLAEGMTLAEKNGITRDTYMSFIDEVLPAPIVHGYGTRMAADAFEAGQGFTVTLGLKDVNLMRKLGESSEVPLPLADVAFNHLLAAKAAGLADKDWSALALAVRQSAGMTMTTMRE